MMQPDRVFLALAPRPRRTLRLQELAIRAPETKSVQPDNPLELVDKMLFELRQQFFAIRRVRLDARKKILEAGEDEARIRVARTDLKAAVDAMNLVVRTLEKLDSLRRGLEAERHRAEDEKLELAGLGEGRQRLAALVNQRIEEEVARRLAERLAERFAEPLPALIDPEGMGHG